MSAFGLGFKTFLALCQEQKPLLWYEAKFSDDMFKPGEVECFAWIDHHVRQYGKLPQVQTLTSNFPDLVNFQAPEPAKYYLDHLQARRYYEVINEANMQSQGMLKANSGDWVGAMSLLNVAVNYITTHQYRHRIMNLAKEGPQMVLKAYHNIDGVTNSGVFGWNHLDASTGGMLPGDVVTIIGRPAAGKTWLVMYMALANWLKGKKILFVSMEMAPLPIIQRLTSMYTSVSINQLKGGKMSSSTYQAFSKSLITMAGEAPDFHVVDGNLAATMEDIYVLAAQLGVEQVYIDGAYLTKHANKRLDRYTRVAENAEMMKQCTSELRIPSIASYQFARTASKGKVKGEAPTMDDIGYSDVIAQISSIALGLFQDDSVETLEGRKVRILKGRNGEIGEFLINWNFWGMDFSQKEKTSEQETALLEYI